MPCALIIDDSRNMADSLEKMVRLLGLEADVAYGPRTGMMQVRKRTPDVILLDISMPGVDGFEVMAYFRRIPALKDVPIIVVTSDDQPETAKKARVTGALTLIVKPPTLESLERAFQIAGILPTK